MNKQFKSEAERIGYRDAMMGQDFIKQDQSLDYYDGVAQAMLELEWVGE